MIHGYEIALVALGGFAFGCYIVGLLVIGHDNKRLAKYKEEQEAEQRAERELRWTVVVETKANYFYPDADGKYTKDKHSAVVVSCVREGSDDVVIGHHDSRKDDLKSEITALVTKAEDRCADLNALEVSNRKRHRYF